MMQKALSSIEEVPYCFLGSSIKFQGHTGWKIDKFNLIWVRLLGQSQLSNPSDLPCFAKFQNFKFWQLFKICNFDLVSFWLGIKGIRYESIIWVNMGQWGYSRNAGILLALVHPVAAWPQMSKLGQRSNDTIFLRWSLSVIVLASHPCTRVLHGQLS